MSHPFSWRRHRVALATAAAVVVGLSTAITASATETEDTVPIQLVTVDTPTREHKQGCTTSGSGRPASTPWSSPTSWCRTTVVTTGTTGLLDKSRVVVVPIDSVTPDDLDLYVFCKEAGGELVEVGEGLIETWTLTCEKDGTVLERIPVIVDRGEQVKANLRTCIKEWA